MALMLAEHRLQRSHPRAWRAMKALLLPNSRAVGAMPPSPELLFWVMLSCYGYRASNADDRIGDNRNE